MVTQRYHGENTPVRTRPPRAPLPALAGANLLCMAAYLAAAALCFAMSIPRGNGSPIWLPTGVALAMLLRWGRLMWPGIALGSAAVNLYLMWRGPGLTVASVGCAALITAGNVLEAVLAHRLVRTLHRGIQRDSSVHVYGYLLATASAALLSAGAGALALAAAGSITTVQRPAVATLWWLGDVTALLLATPLLYAWTQAGSRRRLAARAVESAIVFAATAALTLAVFHLELLGDAHSYGPPFLLLFPVGWAALRLGPAGSTTTVAVAAAGAVVATLAGGGQFVTRSQLYSLLTLDVYLAMLAITGMVLTNTAAGQEDAPGGALRGRWPALTLALCLTVTVGAWHAVARYTERRIAEQFRATAEATWQQMNYRLSDYRRLLSAGKALFDASESVSAGEWHSFAGSFELPVEFPGTQGLGFAAWVPSGAIRTFEQRQRGDEPTFAVWPVPATGHAAVVTYLEPRDGRNEHAIGYDMFSDPARRAAMAAAASEGRIASTGVLVLVQEIDRRKQLGFLMYQPVYRHGASVDTAEQRLAALQGFVYCPFRIGDMMASMVSPAAPFTLRIHDGPGSAPERLIYSSAKTPDSGSDRYVRPLTQARALPIDETGRQWTVELTATAAFEEAIDRHSSLIILALGTLVSLLMFEVVKNLATTRSRALHLARDMTRELKQQQQAVLQSETRFRLFTASVRSHAIIFLDGGGRVEAWNEGATNLFGYTDEETVGRALALWDDPQQGAAAVASATALGHHADTCTLVRKDGSRFTGELQLTSVHADDSAALTGFAFIVRDVTAAQAAAAALRRAMEHAESANRAKSSFVANMSHELRTPMNAVLGIAALLTRTKLDSEQHNFVNMIRSSGQTLLAVLNDILDFSKIEAGAIELDPGPTSVDALARAAAALMAVSGGGRLRLIVDVDPALPAVITADALRLEQILTNLIGNALKFTEQGTVRCDFRAADASLRVTVGDTGIGMDPAQQQRLFSPFVQADASTSRRFGGTGLGLTIARSLAERMGGTLAVSSAPGSGSTFTLTLPLQPAPGAADPCGLPADACGLDVLLFESDPEVAAALRHATARWQWRLHAVNDFDEARLTLGGTGPLPHRLAIVGPSSPGSTALALLGQRRQRLAPDFALIQVSAGFAPPAPGAAQAFPFAQVHAPATRASLHDAMLQLTSHGTVVPAPDSPAGAAPLQGMRLLLAEDHPINQIVAVTMLQFAGATVTVANNGHEAVAALREAPRTDPYAAVLMDVQMPELDGLGAARQIRDELRMALPIIAMTAGVTEAERAACAAAGMNDFVAKPVEEEALIATLRKYRL